MSKDTTTKDYEQRLTAAQYDVLFNKATEAPFSGEYNSTFQDGVYTCVACGTQLFESGKKFDAHCGWPSFYEAIAGRVKFHDDSTLGMKRAEVTCTTCGGHLGHVFEGEKFDTPTDTRYCINSLSLKFTPASEK